MITKSEILLIRSLSDKKAREEHRLFVAEGAKLVEDITGSDLDIDRIFCTDANVEHFAGSQAVTTKEMERISHLKTPSGVLALVRLPRMHGFDVSLANRDLVLALDGVQDPGNLGTIIRIADWFGIRNVICSPTTADCFNPKVVQATMGAITRVGVHYIDLAEVLSSVVAPVYGTFLDGENIYGSPLSASGIVVMGSEGKGVSPDVERLVTHRLYIPPYPAGEPSAESLNVAVATAIVCSEFRRKASL